MGSGQWKGVNFSGCPSTPQHRPGWDMKPPPWSSADCPVTPVLRPRPGPRFLQMLEASTLGLSGVTRAAVTDELAVNSHPPAEEPSPLDRKAHVCFLGRPHYRRANLRAGAPAPSGWGHKRRDLVRLCSLFFDLLPTILASEWAGSDPDDDVWHWVLGDPRPLPERIPMTGRLRLRTTEIDLAAVTTPVTSSRQ